MTDETVLFSGTTKTLKDLDTWYSTNTTKNALLIGPTGIGKNFTIDAFVQRKNLHAIYIACSEKRSKTTMIDTIKKAVGHDNVLMLMQNNLKKKIVVIDEFETLSDTDMPLIKEMVILTKMYDLQCIYLSSTVAHVTHLNAHVIHHVPSSVKELTMFAMGQIGDLIPDHIYTFIKQTPTDIRQILQLVSSTHTCHARDSYECFDTTDAILDNLHNADIPFGSRVRMATSCYVPISFAHHENYHKYTHDIDAAIHTMQSLCEGDIMLSNTYGTNEISEFPCVMHSVMLAQHNRENLKMCKVGTVASKMSNANYKKKQTFEGLCVDHRVMNNKNTADMFRHDILHLLKTNPTRLLNICKRYNIDSKYLDVCIKLIDNDELRNNYKASTKKSIENLLKSLKNS